LKSKLLETAGNGLIKLAVVRLQERGDAWRRSWSHACRLVPGFSNLDWFSDVAMIARREGAEFPPAIW